MPGARPGSAWDRDSYAQSMAELVGTAFAGVSADSRSKMRNLAANGRRRNALADDMVIYRLKRIPLSARADWWRKDAGRTGRGGDRPPLGHSRRAGDLPADKMIYPAQRRRCERCPLMSLQDDLSNLLAGDAGGFFPRRWISRRFEAKDLGPS